MHSLSMRIPAPPDTVFAMDAFEAQVGNDASLMVDRFGVKITGRLTSAVVATDRRSVFVTVETDDDAGMEVL